MLRIASLVAVLVALALPVAAGATGNTGQVSTTREPSLESLVLQRINEVRAAYGLGRLGASTGLTRAAVAHSRAMAVNGFFAHESQNGTPFWQRLKTYYGPYVSGWTVGENLAMFGGVRPDAAAIVTAWMASPPHRANLLSRSFSDAGIAILHDPAGRGVYGGASTWIVTLDVGAR